MIVVLILLLLSAIDLSVIANSAWSNTARGLETKTWAGERGRVDCGHPDSGLVDLEEVGNEGVEVDVGVGEVVEGQLLPVPV